MHDDVLPAPFFPSGLRSGQSRSYSGTDSLLWPGLVSSHGPQFAPWSAEHWLFLLCFCAGSSFLGIFAVAATWGRVWIYGFVCGWLLSALRHGRLIAAQVLIPFAVTLLINF